MKQTMSYPTIIVYAIGLSFCSFMYEMLLAKTIGALMSETVIAQSVAIGVYIAGLGMGMMLCSKRKREDILPAERLLSIEILLMVVGGLCVFLILSFNILGTYVVSTNALNLVDANDLTYLEMSDIVESAPFVIFWVLAILIIMTIGVLSGYEIPLLIQMAEQSGYVDKDNEIIGYSALGTLLASVFFSFILIRIVDVDVIAALCATFNGILAVCIFMLSYQGKWLKYTLRLTVAWLVIAISMLITPLIYQWDLRAYYYYDFHNNKVALTPEKFYEFIRDNKTIHRIKTPYQYIDVVQKPGEQSSEDELAVFLNRQFQFQVIFKNDAYHEGMAHVPVNIAGAVPENILVLGAGDGLLIHQLLQYNEQVHSITHIELDRKMTELALNHPVISKLNGKSLQDEKVTTIYSDAFYHVKHSEASYDAIYIDFPYPNNYDLMRLYSQEFLHFVKQRLKPYGFIVMDIPVYNDNEINEVSAALGQKLKDSNNVFFNTLESIDMPFGVFDAGADPFVYLSFNDGEIEQKLSSPTMYRYFRPEIDAPRQVRVEHYSYDVDERYINSIFHPKLLGFIGHF